MFFLQQDNTCGYFEWVDDAHHSTIDLKYQLLNMETLLEMKFKTLEKKLDKLESIEMRLDKLQVELPNIALGVTNVMEEARKITFNFVILVAMYVLIYYVI